jgi:hypothetical protein
MRLATACCFALAALMPPAAAQGQPKTIKQRVILLLDVNTQGLPKGAQVARVEVVKGDGKRELKDVTASGKPQPRLVGVFEVRTCNIKLADGKVLEGREALVAIDVGRQSLRDVRYVETCEGQTPKGVGRFYAYTAEYEQVVKETRGRLP